MTDKYIPDKPLREYTVGEIHDICEGTNCDVCPFNQRDVSCPFYDQTPNLWRVGESVEAEAVTVAPEWISVKERLPEKDGDYLAYFSCLDGMGVCHYDRLNRWTTTVHAKVLYWMPLPNPPEEECNDV